MARQGHDSNFPNQLYGWQIMDDGSWSLYSENGTALITTSQSGVFFPGLPTLDPHVVNQAWNSAGTLKISSG